MPNQCVHCNEMYDDGAPEILKGCSSCGSRFFFYMSQDKIDRMKVERDEPAPELTAAEKKQIESDVRDIARIEDDDAPIVLDFESVKIIKPGKYLLDIANLFSKERPLVYKLEEGKYVIDLAAQIKNVAKNLLD